MTNNLNIYLKLGGEYLNNADLKIKNLSNPENVLLKYRFSDLI